MELVYIVFLTICIANVIPMISSADEFLRDSSYKYSYEGEKGMKVSEEGKEKGTGEDAGHTAKGTYTYTSPEGKEISVTWYADETGFHAEGEHIPTSS